MRVIVIGCGLAGLTTAWFLRAQGADVVVIDRALAPARETSFANGSMITPSLADPWNAPGSFEALLRSIGREDSAMLLRRKALPSLALWGVQFLKHSKQELFQESFRANVVLARYSQTVMAELLQAQPLAFDYAPDGTVKVFSDNAAFQRGREVASWLRHMDIEHRELDRDGLLRLEPALEDSIDRYVGAIHYLQDEVGNARSFCEALHRKAMDAGVDFRFSEMVLNIEREGRRIVSLRTAREVLVADAFVLAAGSYSWPVGKRFGIRVPVRPAKGYSLTLPTLAEAPRPGRAIVDDALHAAVVPLGEAELRVAGTAEFAGFDSELTPARLDNLKALLLKVYPRAEAQLPQARGWCGFRPMTPDGRPLIGRTRVENLFLNTGHGPLGWTLACGSAKALADQMLEKTPETDLEPFRVERI